MTRSQGGEFDRGRTGTQNLSPMTGQGSVLVRGGVVVPMTAPGTFLEADVLLRDGLVSAI